MAKKTVASLQKGEGRTYSKVIKMVKSPKTGAYIFKEEMMPNEAVKDALKESFTSLTTLQYNQSAVMPCIDGRLVFILLKNHFSQSASVRLFRLADADFD